MHSIHGRAPAIATGLAASRPDLSVWVITGDGDALSIGGNHLIHALRRNVNIKILLFNNRIYGLTKGQYSPTSEQGKVTKSTPFGSLDTPFNPVSLALGAEASFVARTIDSDRKHLTSVLRAAADHRGTAFVEIYQNCPIFNDDAFVPLTSPESRDDTLIRLEHGEPVRFGADGSRGLRFGRTGSLEAVDVAGADPDSLVVHDAHAADPSYAFALVPAGQRGLRPHPDRRVPAAAAGQLRRPDGRADRCRPGPRRARATWPSCWPARTPGRSAEQPSRAGEPGRPANRGAMSVRVERDGPVSTVILDRPAVRNAVDGPTAAAPGGGVPRVRGGRHRPRGRAVRCGRHVLRRGRPEGHRRPGREPGRAGR